MSVGAWATGTGAIPTPGTDDDPTTGSNNFVTILVDLIKNDIGPVLIYGGAMFFFVMAAFDMYRGYKKYQDTDDFGKFKMSIIAGVILGVIGLTLLFTGQHVLTTWAGK